MEKNNRVGKTYSPEDFVNSYHEGFFTKLCSEELPIGIDESIVRKISSNGHEPNWMLQFRLRAYRTWLTMKEPHWANIRYPKINYNEYCYYSVPVRSVKSNNKKTYLTDKVKETFRKLGVPTKGTRKTAVDAVFDSVSVSTSHRKILAKKGIVFCSFNYAIRHYSDLVRQYLGSVVPIQDNFFAALNSAVASDGTFVYIPKNTSCPIELSTYFRMNSIKTNQFERTIIVADSNSSVDYLEGCSAPITRHNQLHAAVVEVVVSENAHVRYSTVQNWYAGSKENKGILNFVTKRALCRGKNSKMSWTQSETGSTMTWKYPSIVLRGENARGQFFSVALTNHCQQADTGTKMIHLGRNTRSTIVSKSISLGRSRNTYRGLVVVEPSAGNAKNFTQCDSMLIGDECRTYALPCIRIKNHTAKAEHEATSSCISTEQLFFFRQRGIDKDDAVSIIVNGFCQSIFVKFPFEFSVEAQKLLNVHLRNSVG